MKQWKRSISILLVAGMLCTLIPAEHVLASESAQQEAGTSDELDTREADAEGAAASETGESESAETKSGGTVDAADTEDLAEADESAQAESAAEDEAESDDVEPTDPWEGTADTSWYQESQKKFTLNTPEELAGLAELVNGGNTFEGKKILLGADLFFNAADSTANSWTPIGAASNDAVFEGTFDGQGHYLRNLYMEEDGDPGLFGTIGENGIVKAIRISQSQMSGAAIAAENNGWILFCENYSSVGHNHAAQNCGGICSLNNGMIYGCGNYGDVVDEISSAGGIAGMNDGDESTASIESCWNLGYVYGDEWCTGGIAAQSYGWIYDCYNGGTVTGNSEYQGGIAGDVHMPGYSGRALVYNCYFAGELTAVSGSDVMIGGYGNDDKTDNVYTLPSDRNDYATEVSLETLQSEEAIAMLSPDAGVLRWCTDTDGLNHGMAIPVAQQDMHDGVYKMLPDIWYPVTEVSITMDDQEYQLKAFGNAFYGQDEISAVYGSDSDLLTITPEGVITPLKTGTATVHVAFEETEHAKACSYDVTVTITENTCEHQWDSGTITAEPTCVDTGIKTYTCALCGRTKKETIAATGEHDYTWEVTKEATKEAEGEKTGTCRVCGKKITRVIPKLSEKVSVKYRTHVQTYGWKSYVSDGALSGTTGQAKRLEAINIKLDTKADLGIQYTTHCQTYGWLPWSADGEMNGTSGEAKRLEAIKIQLTGDDADRYDVYYRVHAQTYGWLGWAKNGAAAGTAGYAKRLESIQIVVVPKGDSIDQKLGGIVSARSKPYISATADPTVSGANRTNVAYRTHVQTYGWQGYKYNGTTSGTSGLAKRLEGIEISLTNKQCAGGIRYRTHVQTYGWQSWKYDGAMSGTSGQAKRLEAIQIELTGDMAEKYDVYYRVHAQKFGWMGWAKNGESAGTAGYAYRLEAIQIQLVEKGAAAPGSMANAFKEK